MSDLEERMLRIRSDMPLAYSFGKRITLTCHFVLKRIHVSEKRCRVVLVVMLWWHASDSVEPDMLHRLELVIFPHRRS